MTPWRDHLILDSGLNKVATVAWPNCFQYMLLGAAVSPVPVRRDGGATTFSQAGTTLTASTNFFVAADVGRLFKFGTGTGGSEAYITGYTSATQVTLGTSATVGATVGAVWYVNEVALTSLDSATNSYVSGAANNGSTLAGSTVTHKRTFLGAAVAAPKTYTEIGFNDTSSNAALFDRDLISPSVSLAIGDQPLCVCVLTVTYSPTTPLAVGNVGTGVNTAGDIQIEGLAMGVGYGIYVVSSSGATTGTGSGLEPHLPGNVIALNSAVSFATFSAADPAVRGGTEIALAMDAYTAGSFSRTKRATFTPTQANYLIYGLGFSGINGRSNITQRFTTQFTKTSSQQWTNVFRVSWGRILSN